MQIFAIGLGFSLVLAWPIIIAIRQLNVSQKVREEGPRSHYAKTGTPTLGGLIFILAAVFATLLTGQADKFIWWGIYGLVAYGAIGFADDFLKVFKASPYGLSGRWTFVLQILASVPFVAFNLDVLPKSLGAWSPLWLDCIFFVVLMVGTVNAVNLADGLDGLAAGATSITLLCLTPIIMTTIPTAAIVPLATGGALIGFLFVNFKPAKIWMGNFGSNALGGLVAISAIYSGHIWLFAVGAGLFIIEDLSSIIQIGYFKYTKYLTPAKKGVRIFKMSPIHHHFELSGWSEMKVVLVFWLASALFGGLMLGLFYLLK